MLFLPFKEDKDDLGACVDARERRAKVCFQQEEVFGVEERIEEGYGKEIIFPVFTIFFHILIKEKYKLHNIHMLCLELYREF